MVALLTSKMMVFQRRSCVGRIAGDHRPYEAACATFDCHRRSAVVTVAKRMQSDAIAGRTAIRARLNLRSYSGAPSSGPRLSPPPNSGGCTPPRPGPELSRSMLAGGDTADILRSLQCFAEVLLAGVLPR